MHVVDRIRPPHQHYIRWPSWSKEARRPDTAQRASRATIYGMAADGGAARKRTGRINKPKLRGKQRKKVSEENGEKIFVMPPLLKFSRGYRIKERMQVEAW